MSGDQLEVSGSTGVLAHIVSGRGRHRSTIATGAYVSVGHTISSSRPRADVASVAFGRHGWFLGWHTTTAAASTGRSGTLHDHQGIILVGASTWSAVSMGG
jgi:hypothetical protein